MGRHRSLAVAGLGLAVVCFAPVVAAFAAGRGEAAPTPAPAVVVAVGPAGATATVPGGRRLELPWLQPGDRDPAVSPDGRTIAFASERDGNLELYVANAATGRVLRLTKNRIDDRAPAWSPDGRLLAWQTGKPGAHDIAVMAADGSRKRRLAGGPADDVEPAWSPDGRRVVFASSRAGAYDLWTAPRAGGPAALLHDGPADARSPAWSADGRRIAFTATAGGNADLWLLDVERAVARHLTRGPGGDVGAAWSPDGRSLVFTRMREGTTRPWVVRPGGGAARPLAGGRRGDAGATWVRAAAELVPPPSALLPDLDQLTPTGLVVLRVDGSWRLGSTSAVENLGDGPLWLRGTRAPGARTMRTSQLIELRGGGTQVVPGVGRMRFEPHPPHFHWHFQPFARYELRRLSDFGLVVRDRKSGFCLIDRWGRTTRKGIRPVPPRFVGDCASRQRDALRVEEGTSVGYVDRYPGFFHGQDVDLRGVPAGLYVLVHRSNPDGLLRELRLTNNAASVLLRLSWPGGPEQAPRVEVLRTCGASERCPLPGLQ